MATTAELMAPFAKGMMQSVTAIAPEREKELWEEIVREEKWTFEFTDGPAQYFADTGEHAVMVSHAGLAALWCLAFVAFHTIDAALVAQRQHGGRHDSPANIDIGEHWGRFNLKCYLEYAECLMKADEEWPAGMAQPNPRAPFDSIEGRINNAFLGAAAFILLHEVGHVHHRDVADNRMRKMQEERADLFAARWIFDDAGGGLNREFRIVMVTIAILYLFLVERRWGTRATYPTAHERLSAAVQHFNAGPRSIGVMSAAALLKAVLDPASVAPEAFTDAAAYLAWVQRRLQSTA